MRLAPPPEPEGRGVLRAAPPPSPFPTWPTGEPKSSLAWGGTRWEVGLGIGPRLSFCHLDGKKPHRLPLACARAPLSSFKDLTHGAEMLN